MTLLVPYVINGAAHSAALFRRQAQHPAGAVTGVVLPGDLMVTQLPQVAAGVRIAEGGLSLVSRFPGRSRETYGVENADGVIDVTGLNGTGSSPRRDAVVIEVLDPNYLTGWTHETAAPLNYMKVHVVEGVDPAAKNIDGLGADWRDRTAYVLAFIDWPENQTTVQGSYIKDARKLAAPRVDEFNFARPRVDSDGNIYLTGLNANGGGFFPGGGGGSPNQFTVDMPDYATRMTIWADWAAVTYDGSKNPRGAYWMEFGDELRNHTWDNKQQYEFATQKFAFNSPATTDELTDSWALGATVAVPAKLRGKTVTFAFKAGRNDAVTSANNKAVRMSGSGGLRARVRVTEQAIDAYTT